jgi:uncharacterized membrane protein
VPTREAWRAFAIRLLTGAGVTLLGAGTIFFIAANWDRFGPFGRFALLEAAIVACALAALRRPPPHPAGRAALVLALLLAGALLALFGQAYQTGADVYELFAAWAALALPFALAARSGAAWAVWWGVVNVAMGLYCGWLGPGHFMWEWLDRWGTHKAVVLLAPCAVNLAAAHAFTAIREGGDREAAPRWLTRLLAALGFLYGTAAALLAIVASGWNRAALEGQDVGVIAVFAAVSAAIALLALRSRRDVFPMALVIGSWIAVSTVFLVTRMRFDSIGVFFLMALWIVGASSGAGYALMRWVREWNAGDDDAAAEAGA